MDIWDIFGHFYLNHLSPLWGYFLTHHHTRLEIVIVYQKNIQDVSMKECKPTLQLFYFYFLRKK